MSADDLQGVFEHFAQYHIVICKACETPSVVLPNEIRTHLEKKHDTLDLTTRIKIETTVAAIPDLARTSAEVVYPEPTSAAVPYLHVNRNGFKCTVRKADGTPCGIIRSELKKIQDHCRKHPDYQPRKRGRKPKGWVEPDPPFIGGVIYQRFFSAVSKDKQALFEVEARGQQVEALVSREEHESQLLEETMAALKLSPYSILLSILLTSSTTFKYLLASCLVSFISTPLRQIDYSDRALRLKVDRGQLCLERLS
jgi:Orsellinic acid/F9775 biosynthesis cluster protein D